MIIGVTGSFGSGKTSVAKMFRGLGACVIDADRVCHSLMLPQRRVYKKIVRHFGSTILKKDRFIDRKKLAEIVFKQNPKLKLLNKIVHPEAVRKINRIIQAKKRRKIIVIDAALLVESNFYKGMDKLIVVRTDRDSQIKRMVRAKGMTRKEVMQRIRMQGPFKKKLALADFIIDNSGSKRQTLFQVKKIWKQLGVGYGSKRKIGH